LGRGSPAAQKGRPFGPGDGTGMLTSVLRNRCRPRDPAYIFVSTRPSENVRNEISIVIGYPFKPGADANVDIGSAKYAMYTQNDGAWIKNAAEEARMVDAMRRGSDLVVSGESGKGTKSTDRYNLRGLAQALDRVAQECK